MLAALALVAAACAGVTDRVDELRNGPEPAIEDREAGSDDLVQRTRFCLSLARAVAALDSSSPATVSDAVEETFAQAPPELRDEAREVIEVVRAAQASEDRDALQDPAVQRSLQRLHQRSRELCDPT